MKGIGTALVTPFQADGSIDFQALQRLIEHQINGGIDYLVILGTTSEVPTLSPDEQQSIIQFVIEHVAGRVPLVLGVGGNNTAAMVNRLHQLTPVLQQHFMHRLQVLCFHWKKYIRISQYQYFCL